jgi:outer membrane protein insertion porin family
MNLRGFPARRSRLTRQAVGPGSSCCFMLLVLSSSPLWAQEAQPNSYAGFEGSHVANVEISVRPTLDAEAFRPLIRQKPGEPFSVAAVRDSVTGLEKTNEFSEVQVSIEPQQAGLKVLFTLQLTSYVGMIFFPGATQEFSYTRLLQAVNIPEQSPFVDDLPSQGQSALLHFFSVNGYFVSTVEPEIERDDAHRIVNLIFKIHLNKRARVGNINIAGVTPTEAADMRRALASFWARVRRANLKTGTRYSQQRIGTSVDYIRSYLRKEGRLAPVARHVSSEYHRETNRADLTFQVEPGPLLSVRITGAHVWKRTIERLIPIYEENSVDSDLVAEGERNLVSYFESKGYFDVKVETHRGEEPNKVSIVYQVDRGIRHRVEGVNFEGNHYFDDDKLEATVSVKKGHSILGHFFSHGSYSDELVRKSVNALTALYEDAGFAKVSINPVVKDYEPQVDVTFRISEGEQDKVGSIRVDGNRKETVQTLTGGRGLNLEPGKPYSRRLLELDRNQILAAYLNRGYLNARFQSTAMADPSSPHLLNVVYSINEGPAGHTSDVVILGTNVTKPDFITSVTDRNVGREKALSEGSFFTAESDLYNLGIFDWASVKPLRPISSQNQEEVLIKVHESKRYTLDFGGGIEVIPRSGNIPVGTVALPGIPPIGLGSKFRVSQKSFFGPRFSFDIAKHNLRGRAETATFATVLSRLSQSGSFTYADPRLHGSSWSSLFSVSAERTTENPLYTADLGQGSFQIEKSLDAAKTKNLIIRYSFRRTDLSKVLIPDLILPKDQRLRLSTFAAEYIRDTRDKPLDAHHGVYQTFDFGVTPTALGSSASFVRFLGQSSFYIQVRPWLTWANNFRLGVAVPFSGSAVPLSERFFTGGADSLRGFPINGAGPQRPVNVCSNPRDSSTCTLISVPVGGDALFILNSELRFPIPVMKGLGGVAFYDGGNVYTNVNFKQFANDYTNTVGFGIRYQTPVGPIRLDFGHRLTAVPGVKATQYFVTLGQSF